MLASSYTPSLYHNYKTHPLYVAKSLIFFSLLTCISLTPYRPKNGSRDPSPEPISRLWAPPLAIHLFIHYSRDFSTKLDLETWGQKVPYLLSKFILQAQMYQSLLFLQSQLTDVVLVWKYFFSDSSSLIYTSCHFLHAEVNSGGQLTIPHPISVQKQVYLLWFFFCKSA